ncbi:MAG: flagellar hook-associated protein FlgL [Rubrivivax sp.]|jgi:flagellar hook-associated protein 3 FlgL|nr:flagellar hook-associated protein FlgL [Rubrivivax sp.]
MSMRVTTYNSHAQTQAQLQIRQQAMQESQIQLTSGKRTHRPSDDPTSAADAERALARIQRADAEQRALSASLATMTQAESALGTAGELLQQAREYVVQAGNGSYGDKEREALAQSLRGLREDLLSVANRSDGTGRYLFGGQGADGAPLLDTVAGVDYQGAGGTLRAAMGESSPLSMDGREVWLQAPNPRAPGTTLSVFDTLDRLVSELSTPNRTGAQISAGVRDGLADLDASANHLLNARARSGEAMNRIESIQSRVVDQRLQAQVERSEAEDLDMVEAISKFQAQQTGYDAALRTYAQVQRMSLFDYLGG